MRAIERVLLSGLGLCLLLGLSACAGSTRTLSKEELRETVSNAETASSHEKQEEARQTVALALAYFDQGGYEKSADLLLQAADLYRVLGQKEDEKRTLLATARMHLKCSRMEAFLLAMARYRTLLGPVEMPSEDARFFLNLSDQISKRPLSYPVRASWQVVFDPPR